MSNNPYAASISRFIRIAGGALLAGAFLFIVILSITSEKAPGFSRGASSLQYTRVDSPSQFWFSVTFNLAFAVLAGVVAWRAYRE